MMTNLFRYTFLVFVFFSCSSQSKLEVSDPIVTDETKADEKQIADNGVFVRSGVGYQGYVQQEINALPEFRVPTNTNNITQAINNAIKNASENNHKGKLGGRVVIEKGVYEVGTIVLKSNVHIILEEGLVLKADQSNASNYKRTKLVFDIGKDEPIENVSIVGKGTEETRPLISYHRETTEQKVGGVRAFILGAAKNVFIQNVTIQDDQTRFSGVVFSFGAKDFSDAGRANQVTVNNVKQINASYGYGLIQANTGKNLLFTNLTCSGGVCARIETDNRYSKSPYGVANVVIENVTSIKGKAAVYLNPHTVVSGDVHIDGAHAIASQMAIEIRPGFEDPDGIGRYGKHSSIKNVSAEYGLNTSVHFSGKSSIPKCLLPYFKDDIKVDAENPGVRQGPSICVIGDYVGQFIIDMNTVSASVPKSETHVDNTIAARKLIVSSKAYRGSDASKQCGLGAYE